MRRLNRGEMLIIGTGAGLFALSCIYFDIWASLAAALIFSVAGCLALRFAEQERNA